MEKTTTLLKSKGVKAVMCVCGKKKGGKLKRAIGRRRQDEAQGVLEEKDVNRQEGQLTVVLLLGKADAPKTSERRQLHICAQQVIWIQSCGNSIRGAETVSAPPNDDATNTKKKPNPFFFFLKHRTLFFFVFFFFFFGNGSEREATVDVNAQ